MATTRVVRDNRAAVLASINAQVEQAVAKAAHDIEAGAKAAAPVATGFLRGSIQAQQVGPAHWRVAVGAAYGWFVEMGTRFKAARPFLYPAYVRVSAVLMQALRRIRGH